ncbi:hypothetical protein CAOG_05749 [Capsaspora owczarzaki ATCC 30864]|nr:hypothetical protein CAOG_05749 [Capsaspora owczarzaki ATCC 30864]|eukprot:XP_004346422.2 hypothetical protein CAOG_05749 [Capsaspora owczarzaki ATCC 30864]
MHSLPAAHSLFVTTALAHQRADEHRELQALQRTINDPEFLRQLFASSELALIESATEQMLEMLPLIIIPPASARGMATASSTNATAARSVASSSSSSSVPASSTAVHPTIAVVEEIARCLSKAFAHAFKQKDPESSHFANCRTLLSLALVHPAFDDTQREVLLRWQHRLVTLVQHRRSAIVLETHTSSDSRRTSSSSVATDPVSSATSHHVASWAGITSPLSNSATSSLVSQSTSSVFGRPTSLTMMNTTSMGFGGALSGSVGGGVGGGSSSSSIHGMPGGLVTSHSFGGTPSLNSVLSSASPSTMFHNSPSASSSPSTSIASIPSHHSYGGPIGWATPLMPTSYLAPEPSPSHQARQSAPSISFGAASLQPSPILHPTQAPLPTSSSFNSLQSVSYTPPSQASALPSLSFDVNAWGSSIGSPHLLVDASYGFPVSTVPSMAPPNPASLYTGGSSMLIPTPAPGMPSASPSAVSTAPASVTSAPAATSAYSSSALRQPPSAPSSAGSRSLPRQDTGESDDVDMDDEMNPRSAYASPGFLSPTGFTTPMSKSPRNSTTDLHSSMKDVPMWLKSLRLHKYLDLFAPLHYNQMLQLTDSELQTMGVSAAGARKKILLSIHKLKERDQTLAKLEQHIVDPSKFLSAIEELKTIVCAPLHSDAADDAEPDTSAGSTEFAHTVMHVLSCGHDYLIGSLDAPEHHLSAFLVLLDKTMRQEMFSGEHRARALQWRQECEQLLRRNGGGSSHSHESVLSPSSSLSGLSGAADTTTAFAAGSHLPSTARWAAVSAANVASPNSPQSPASLDDPSFSGAAPPKPRRNRGAKQRPVAPAGSSSSSNNNAGFGGNAGNRNSSRSSSGTSSRRMSSDDILGDESDDQPLTSSTTTARSGNYNGSDRMSAGF